MGLSRSHGPPGWKNKLARKEHSGCPNAHTPCQATSVWATFRNRDMPSRMPQLLNFRAADQPLGIPAARGGWARCRRASQNGITIAIQERNGDVQYAAHRSEGRHAGFTAQRSPLVGALFPERRTGERQYASREGEAWAK